MARLRVEPVTASPLGRYSELAALVSAMGILAVWLLIQVGIFPTAADPGAINAMAALAGGILLGQRSTTNGAAKVAAKAHERLDELERRTGIATHPVEPT